MRVIAGIAVAVTILVSIVALASYVMISFLTLD